jgi:hypothetical protein
MATQATNTTTFMDKLLAPLPADVEQVSSKLHNRALLEDAKRVWHIQKLKTNAVQYHRQAADLLCLHTEYCHPETVASLQLKREDQHEIYIAECDALMRVPAPTVAALRWKEGCREFAGGCPEWEAQITKDCLKLGVPFTPRRLMGAA